MFPFGFRGVLRSGHIGLYPSGLVSLIQHHNVILVEAGSFVFHASWLFLFGHFLVDVKTESILVFDIEKQRQHFVEDVLEKVENVFEVKIIFIEIPEAFVGEVEEFCGNVEVQDLFEGTSHLGVRQII